MKGKLIVLEGLDGSGKQTQAALLADALRSRGENITAVSFPNYGSEAAVLLEKYLHGEYGNDPNDVNAYAATTFFAIDRYVSYHSGWKEAYLGGGTILADRYTTSNAIHQCAKLPRMEWDDFLAWLFRYEYNQLGIPKPDKVIYLRVPTDVSAQLISKRYSGDESQKDIHEANTEYQTACRAAAEYCAPFLGWKTVDCARDGVMRTPEDIHAEIMGLID